MENGITRVAIPSKKPHQATCSMGCERFERIGFPSYNNDTKRPFFKLKRVLRNTPAFAYSDPYFLCTQKLLEAYLFLFAHLNYLLFGRIY